MSDNSREAMVAATAFELCKSTLSGHTRLVSEYDQPQNEHAVNRLIDQSFEVAERFVAKSEAYVNAKRKGRTPGPGTTQ